MSHLSISPPYLVGRAKKRSGRAHEEMTENSFPKTDSEMTDCRGQIGHEQLLTRSTLVGEIVIWSRVEIDSDILPQLQEIWGMHLTIFGSDSNHSRTFGKLHNRHMYQSPHSANTWKVLFVLFVEHHPEGRNVEVQMEQRKWTFHLLFKLRK